MSCNPAIGGLGKGHLVREIDSLDGVMGLAIDDSGIQFRMLNMSRGPAVRGPRAQADRGLYKKSVQKILNEYNNLFIIEDSVEDLIITKNKIEGVITSKAGSVRCRSLVLTTGTFLRGEIKGIYAPMVSSLYQSKISSPVMNTTSSCWRIYSNIWL